MSRTLLIWALAWPLLLADLAWLGNGFEFLPLFVTVAVLARRPTVAITGVLLATLTHPEQALFAFSTLFLLTFAPEFRQLRTRALTGTVAALFTTAVSSLWLASRGVESRAAFFFEWVVDAAVVFAQHAALLVYSGWGVWWVLLLLAFGLLSRRGRVLLVFCGIIIPTALMATTFDGTRVFAGVASAVGVAVFGFLSRQMTESDRHQEKEALLGLSFIALLLMPNIQLIIWGELVTPHGFWLDFARGFLGS